MCSGTNLLGQCLQEFISSGASLDDLIQTANLKSQKQQTNFSGRT